MKSTCLQLIAALSNSIQLLIHLTRLLSRLTCTWLMHHQCNRRTMQNASFTVPVDDYMTSHTCIRVSSLA